ncbi:MAG: peptidase [Actinobacteria bacterium HGW-Actinobacteria-9]|jgi:tripeptide aminopeptidase|nr:MAG: peptidase [Actinobacteria bacterium HGW-Actinobacteria-9]
MDASIDRVLATFLDLVRIDSPSQREGEVAAYCIRELEALGFDVRVDDSARVTGSNTGNVIATLPGNRTDAPILVLSAHMDCVQPCEGVEPVVEGGVVRSAGDTVLGGDDKVGVAAILEAARRLIESGAHRPALRVVLTVAEETGLTGAKALDPRDATGDACLVLDADGEPGGIIISAPTHYTFEATFIGRASHAGVAPEQGRSAIAMASAAVCRMELGRLDDKTTANIGSLIANGATNVVTARAVMTGECRSRDVGRVEQVREVMDAAMRDAAVAHDGQVDVTWTREYAGFDLGEDSPLVRLACDACRDAGLIPRLESTGGGSDGNIFSAAGVPTLVLSCGMNEVHGTDESVAIADLRSLVALVEAFARRMTGFPQ